MNIKVFYIASLTLALSFQQGCGPYNPESTYSKQQRLKNKISELDLAIHQARLQSNQSKVRILLQQKETYTLKMRTLQEHSTQTTPSKNFDFTSSYQSSYPYSTRNTRAQIQADEALARKLQEEEIRNAQRREKNDAHRAQIQADEALARKLQAEEIRNAERAAQCQAQDDARRAQIQADEALARKLQAEEIRNAERAAQCQAQDDARRAQIESDRELAEQLQKEENQKIP